MNTLPGSARTDTDVSVREGIGLLLGFVAVVAAVSVHVLIVGDPPAADQYRWIGGHLLFLAGAGMLAGSLLANYRRIGDDPPFASAVGVHLAWVTVLAAMLWTGFAYVEAAAYGLPEYDLVYDHIIVHLGSGVFAAFAMLTGATAVAFAASFREREIHPPWMAPLGMAIGVITGLVGVAFLLTTAADDSSTFDAMAGAVVVTYLWFGVVGSLGIRSG